MQSSNWGQFFGNPTAGDINYMMAQADKNRAKYERQASAIFMLKTLYSEIDKTPVYKGAGVIYIDNKDTVFKLREIDSVRHDKPIYIVLREPPGSVSISDFGSYIKQNQSTAKEATLMSELTGLAFNCSGVVLGWIGMGLATGTSVLTFGLSSILFVVSAASMATSLAQCGNSAVRVTDQLYNEGKLSRQLDSEEWYNNTMSAIDKIGIATAAAGVGGTFRTLKSLKVDFLTYGEEAVRTTLKTLTPSNKIEISKEIVRKNHPMVNNAFFSTIINGPLAKRAISSTAFDKANLSDLIDALSTSLAVTGNIKANGTLNPKAKTIDGLSIGVLTGIGK